MASVPVQHHKPPATGAEQPGTAKTGPHRRVLLVVDDERLAGQLRATLAQSGYECTSADRRNVAARFDAHRPHAVIVDFGSDPGTAGSILEVLRARAGQNATPIIGLYDDSAEQGLARAARHGVTDVWPRTTGATVLLHRLGHLIRVHTLLRGWRDNEARRRAVLKAMPDTVLRVDRQGVVLEVISEGQGAVGVTLGADGRYRHLDDLLPVPSDSSFADLCAEVVRTHTTAERDLLRTDGEAVRAFDLCIAPLGGEHAIVLLRDVSNRRSSTDRAQHAMNYDSLTGLANRALFMSRMEATLSIVPPEPGSVAVVRLQIDQFETIDQSLGPAAADELLAEMGRRLIALTEAGRDPTKAAQGELVMSARLQPDAFALLAVGIGGESACAGLAERIREPLGKPVRINGREVRSTVSIGISLWPENGHDGETLLRNAALAANHARADGTARLYTDTLRLRSLRSLDLEQHLRSALDSSELSLNYQPKVDIIRKRLIGFEGLLRWDSPSLGAVSPAEVVPIAEQCGLILPLGEWVLNQACRDIRMFQRSTTIPVTVAVNVSASQFSSGNIAEMARRTVTAHGVSPELIELELTESIMMQDVAKALRIFHELRQAGFRLSIDDFGTGYSSLQYLRRMPVNELKIDRSFVRDIADDRSANAICAAVVGLGKSLGLEVIAEGVETPAQAAALRSRGCSRMQGWLIGRPMPASAVPGWIDAGEWRRTVVDSDRAMTLDY